MQKKSGVGKEVMVAVVLGLVMALVITVLLFLLPEQGGEANKNDGSGASPTPITTLPEKTPEPIEFLGLENESVFDAKALEVEGRTFPDVEVVLWVNQKHFVVKSDSEGGFRMKVNLDSGSNVLEAIVVDQDNQSYSDTRLVIYTNKSLEEILLTEAEVATLSSEINE